MYLIHLVLLQYHNPSHWAPFPLTCSKPHFTTNSGYASQRQPFLFPWTLFSENSLTIRKPEGTIQLANMQMESFLSWLSFTCTKVMGKIWWEKLPCAGHSKHWMIYKRNFLLSRGSLLFVTDRGTPQLHWQDFISFHGSIQLHRVKSNLVKHSELSSAA